MFEVGQVRRRAVLAALASAVAVPRHGRAQDAGKDRALRMGVGAQVTSIDPQYHNISPNNAFGSMVYGALVDTDGQSRLVPGLAESWRALADDLWEFKLRPGVTFHNGRPFTADDVRFTFERIPTVVNSPGSYSTYIYSIDRVDTPDPLTLRLHTKGPDPLLPANLSQVWMLNRATHAGAPTDAFNAGAAAIGAGPFKVASVRFGDRIELERNEAWYGPKLPWERVSYRQVTNEASRLASLLAGDVDFIDQVPTADVARLHTDGRVRLSEADSLRVVYIAMDQMRTGPSPFITDNDGKPLDRNDLDETKKKRKAAEEKLYAKVNARYATFTDDEVKTLVVDDQWLATIDARVGGEVARVAHALTTRVRALAERYEKSLPALEEDVEALAARVAGHLKAMGADLKDPKEGAVQRLLTGQTRLPGFSAPWKPKRLGQLGRFIKGSGVRRDQALSGDLPCVRYGEIYTHHNDVIRQFSSRISRAVADTATRIQLGDLMFAGSGETKEEIGKCVALADDVEAYAGGDIIILRPASGNPVFLGYLMNTPQVVRQKANRGQGDAVVHISAAALAAIEVMMPDEPEQDAIARVLSDVDAVICALDARLQKARALKHAMMQALLKGDVRLPIPTEAVLEKQEAAHAYTAA